MSFVGGPMQRAADAPPRALSVDEATQQCGYMANYIKKAARAEALVLEEQGEKEFHDNMEKIKTEEQDKILKEFTKKAKELDTRGKINKSMAINKQRLETIKQRQEKMGEIAKKAEAELKAKLKSGGSGELITKLIVQGLLKLLEDDVVIKCRKADVSAVQGCLKGAQDEYSQVIKSQTGATKNTKLTLAKDNLPDATCLGGVILSCDDGKISIDNTLDARLRLVMEQDKPAIRASLFPPQK